MGARILPALCAALTLAAGPALARGTIQGEEAWPELREALYAQAEIRSGEGLVRLEAPYRAKNDLRVPLGAELVAPAGARIRAVSLIIDENPSPLSARFALAEPQTRFVFSADMRMNGPSPVRVVMETEDGALYMAERYVKTSGVGACSAPPGSNEAEALARLGQMSLERVASAPGAPGGERLTEATAPMVSLNLSHPSHSGMQMDQISLLYIPARFIEEVSVALDGAPYFTMTGSISLSENPAVRFEAPPFARKVEARLRDSDDATFTQSFLLGDS